MEKVKQLPRVLVGPFEAALALLFIMSSSVRLASPDLSSDPFLQLLPVWMFVTYNILYLFSGASILIGLSLARGDFEGAGLFLFVCLLVGRAILFGNLGGWNAEAVLAVVFSSVFVAACLGRLYVILRT